MRIYYVCAKIKTTDFEVAFMKKTILLAMALIILSMSFSGCDVVNRLITKNSGATVGEKTETEKNSYENAKMEYLSNTSDSLTVRIKNDTASTWQSGNMRDYSLEIEKDGEWYTVKQIGEMANTMELMIFAPGDEMTHTFKFAQRYGKLSAGKYRVVKSYWANATETTEAGEFHLVCEFNVE